MKTPIKLLLADDHPLLRKGISSLVLEAFPDAKITEAGNGSEALNQLVNEPYDLALLDMDMPVLSGLEVLEKATEWKADAKVIVLTLHNEQSLYDEAMRLGASAFLLKEFAERDILECITQVLQDKPWMSQGVLNLKSSPLRKSLDSLTRTEQKIIQLVAQGNSTKEIAELLFISPKTVENHRGNVCRKLDLEHKSNALIHWVSENRHHLEEEGVLKKSSPI